MILLKLSSLLLLPTFLLLSTFSYCIAENIDAADSDEYERFCYPAAHKNTRQSCECSNVNASPWGMRAVHVDCSYKDFKATDISETLPLYIDNLDLSWNALDRVPRFVSDSLRLLNVMHNNVTQVLAKNFDKLGNLRELYLSWNSIQSINAGAFDGLVHLQVLDLSHNNLQAMPGQIFAPLLVLESLGLSWNRQLNDSIAQLNVYQAFGMNLKLQTLKLEACSLTTLVLPTTVTLKELYLRRNKFERVPQTLPTTLEKLDISENLLESLRYTDTANLTHVTEFLIEDMPRLQSIGEDSLKPLESLQKISFQNNRRLHSFDAHAFGVNETKWSPTLRSMIFRGTILRTFNSTLQPIFAQLTELDLNGMPLYCDCQLIWVKQLSIETNGRCFKPSRLRGMRITNARTSDFICDSWPRWVYGCVILGLIAICSVGVYLIVMGLRPHRGVTLRRKVGAGSPYARVTIEPNRQENNY